MKPVYQDNRRAQENVVQYFYIGGACVQVH